jgi:uncharacterized tellurite resistance protein B-like protein
MPLLKKFLTAFRPQTPIDAQTPDPDAELALGALLVRVAKADRDYQQDEIVLIDRILGHLYQHNALESAKVRAACERLHAAAPDTDTFGKLIRETTDTDQRRKALDALWEVVLADGVAREGEVRIVEEARMSMGLNLADSQASRGRAEEKYPQKNSTSGSDKGN